MLISKKPYFLLNSIHNEFNFKINFSLREYSIHTNLSWDSFSDRIVFLTNLLMIDFCENETHHVENLDFKFDFQSTCRTPI